jgi:hypothetical protein
MKLGEMEMKRFLKARQNFLCENERAMGKWLGKNTAVQ